MRFNRFPLRVALVWLPVLALLSCTSETVDSDPVTGDAKDPPVEENTAITPCEDGLAGMYPCNGYDLVARVDLTVLDAREANDIWGWADPDSGREFALVGVDNGTVFVELSDPENPRITGKLPTATVSSPWRDIKVYEHYAVIISEASGHGMQIFDLRRLLASDAVNQEFSADAHFTGFGNAHNVVVSPDRPIAYAVGTSRRDAFAGGVHFVDISDPLNPLPAGGYGGSGYTHDAQVIRYSGPDPDYTNRTLFIGSNENELVLVDVTELDAPAFISSVDYEFLEYTHQGWFTEDQTYFLLGDELDEIDWGLNSRTLVFDLTDLDNPQLAFEYTGPTGAIDHNGYVLGDSFYLANYTAGFREIDLSGIGSGNIEETGFFDTFPSHDNAAFDGVWSIYPYLPSGDILINDISSGLFIVRKSNSP